VDLGNRGSILRGLVSKNANPTFQRYLDGIGRLVPDNRSIQGGGNGPPLPGLGAGEGGNNSSVIIPTPSPGFYYASYGFRVAQYIDERWTGFVAKNSDVYTLNGSSQYGARRGEANNYLYCGREESVVIYNSERYDYTFLQEEIVPSLYQSIQTGQRINYWMVDSIVFIPYQDLGSPYSLIEFEGSPTTKISNLADTSNPSSPVITLEATRESMGKPFISEYPFLFNMNLDESFNTKYKFRIEGGRSGGSDVAYNDWASRGFGELYVTFRLYT